MKLYYEKYDDTVQYLGEDKVPGWKPSSEDIVVEVIGETLSLTTKYENGLVDTKIMSIIEHNNCRLVAKHLDDHIGMTVFFRNPEESSEATLTLISHNYIVGRYFRSVSAT